MEAAAWGFIGTLVGALTSIATNLITSRNAAGLQSAAAVRARDEHRRNFQRETLLKLQDELHALLRLAVKVHMHDQKEFHTSGTWGSQPLSPELNEESAQAFRNVGIVAERVADDSLRQEISALTSMLTRATLSQSSSEEDAVFTSAMLTSDQTLRSIGTALRAQL